MDLKKKLDNDLNGRPGNAISNAKCYQAIIGNPQISGPLGSLFIKPILFHKINTVKLLTFEEICEISFGFDTWKSAEDSFLQSKDSALWFMTFNDSYELTSNVTSLTSETIQYVYIKNYRDVYIDILTSLGRE